MGTRANSDPQAVLERYWAAPAGEKPAALSELVAALKALLAESRWAQAARLVQRAFTPSADFTALQSLHRGYARLKPRLETRPTTRLAILGGFTTSHLAQAIELALAGHYPR